MMPNIFESFFTHLQNYQIELYAQVKNWLSHISLPSNIICNFLVDKKHAFSIL